MSYDYSYDNNGNITEIKQNGKLTNKYVYDSLNELKEEYDYVNKFYINYSYDGAGNLQNKYEQVREPNYGYPTGTQHGNTYEYTDTSWKDKLTKVNSSNISYDANGILYNVRYTLTDGGTEYSYYYTHNSRGDIIGIYNGAGELKAHYEYDAWGNVISITDNNGNAITNPNHIGNLNPFRYRGYYQDTETGLYYLMSRYYDTITHRFINADGYFQSGGSILDANTFAYCRNNPIMNSDCTGTSCSKHRSYYVPNCGYCDPSYIHEMNEKIDWLNRVYNTSPEHRIVKVNIDGSRVYGDATLPTVSDGFVTIYSGASTFGGAFTSGYSQVLPYAAVTTLPITAYNIYSYYNDPRLTTKQAGDLTMLELTNFAGTMLLTVAAVSSPPGWVALAVTGVTVVASWVGSEIISHQKNDYISSNKESGLY